MSRCNTSGACGVLEFGPSSKVPCARRCAVLLMLAAALAGCATPPPPPAPQSYVVLLDNGDGTVGKVQVTGPLGSTMLGRAREGVLISAAPGQSFAVPQEQIARDFGAAMAARAKPPSVFVLYFHAGGAKLTPESERELPKIASEIASRDVPDMSVIGHTDTTGDSEKNQALGLDRARLVVGLLQTGKIEPQRVTVQSHGDKNLLIRTAINVDEPRNRRVEVTVR